MVFQTNTKPLCDALNLGIINSNVSNFHKKSTIVQVSADAHTLKINVEASMIKTELKLRGKGEAGSASIFVDSLLLKQLVNTLDSSVVTLDFGEDGLKIISGKSKFTLPKMVDASELSLQAPEMFDYSDKGRVIDKTGWKFVKDNQMYSISLAFIHPVYTYVWVGESGDVLVGDFDSSLFTHSKKVDIGKTCLLSDTIVNLFAALPEGSTILELSNDYIIRYESDSFSYVTQFTPLYESDEEVGSYNSEIILDMMQHPEGYTEVKTDLIVKLLNQSILLSSSTSDTVTSDTVHLSVADNSLRIQDNSVDGIIDAVGDSSIRYELDFSLDSLKSVLSSYNSEFIYISPLVRDEETVGIIVWDADLTTVLAGVE